MNARSGEMRIYAVTATDGRTAVSIEIDGKPALFENAGEVYEFIQGLTAATLDTFGEDEMRKAATAAGGHLIVHRGPPNPTH